MNIIDTLFGRSKTPAEQLRAHQRSLQKAQRELDRERTKLEGQEKKLVMDIKKAAKAGQMVSYIPGSMGNDVEVVRWYQGSCKVMAKDLVRTRRYISKFYAMRTQLQAVSLRLQTLRSNQQMAEAMKGATKAMSLMSRTMNLPQISKILQDFERESSSMDMKEEMMSDTIDDVMEDEGETEEEEGDKILKQVLDEIGVSVSQQLGEAPTGLGAPTAVQERRQAVAVGEGGLSSGGGGGSGIGADPEVDDLQARLDKLRKD